MRMNTSLNKKDILSLTLCIVFTIVLFCSSLYIIENSDHDCVSGKCPKCAEVHVFINFLSSIKFSSLGVSCFLFHKFLSHIACNIFTNYHNSLFDSLVSLKVMILS